MKLVLAEKPSVAMSLSKVIGANQRGDGYMEGNGYFVSWCVGHLVELSQPEAYDEKYAKWRYDDLPILPEHWQYQVSASTKKQFGILKKLMQRKDVESLICATDAGREGELIFRLVYHQCGCKKPVERLWISSMEDSAIREGFQKLRPGTEYDALYEAALCRERADWIVGINATRLFSCLYGQTLNVGRVMTPTLAMVVMRDAAIRAFKPEPFYSAELKFRDFQAGGERMKEKAEAEKLVAECCQAGSAIITKVEQKEKSEKPPALFDLTSLQREANRQLGFTAQQPLDYTQALYEKKLVTYPRTDSQYLSDDMAQTAFDVLWLCDNIFGFAISHTPDISKVINNSKVSGHHAIIPTSKIASTDTSSLPTGEKNILTLIATKLICATAPAHKYEAVKLTGICNGAEFTANGRTVLDIGWKAYAKQSDKKNDEKALPAVSEGQNFTAKASKGEHFTSPPKPYTEDTLLSAMERAGNEDYAEDTEKKGLGTPATRAATIEALVKNGYVERDGKKLRSTDKGRELITVVPDEVKSAKLTAEWESKLQQIEHGSLPESVFMSGIQQFVAEMCRKYGSADKSVTLSDSHEPAGRCPKCGAEVIRGKFGYYCKGKCGMNIAKVYGVELSDAQVKTLLGGKSTSYISKGKKTIVRPEIVENPYNGKVYYQWRTERGK